MPHPIGREVQFDEKWDFVFKKEVNCGCCARWSAFSSTPHLSNVLTLPIAAKMPERLVKVTVF